MIYYNERDPYAAEWLRNLMFEDHIPFGFVDERDIRDVRPDELKQYTQCHFFAGIGVWAYALRSAGWNDDIPIWTGSCPCQPFSAAGARGGETDERHLWPHFHWLIDQCRPSVVVGEQVASKDGLNWLDLVSSDLEASGYAFGASDLCAAGFGGAHIRQRLYFVGLADTNNERHDGIDALLRQETCGRDKRQVLETSGGRKPIRLADTDNTRLEGWAGMPERTDQCAAGQGSMVSGLADANDKGSGGRRVCGPDEGISASAGTALERSQGLCEDSNSHAPMLGRNAADWLYCRDGKWRPVEPGTFPLVDAAPARVGRLRAFGNALDAETAQNFIEAVMDIDL